MFGLFKFNNSSLGNSPVLPPSFNASSIKVDTSSIKARVIAVQPAGILNRAWRMATKDFLPNVGVTLGTAASNVVLDKSLDLLIRSLPTLVRYVGWTSSMALSALPPAFHFLRNNWSTISNSLWRVWTWGSPAAVVANTTSVPTEIKHIIVDQTTKSDMLALIRKQVDEITAPKLSVPVEQPLPSLAVETAQKAVEAVPGYGLMDYLPTFGTVLSATCFTVAGGIFLYYIGSTYIGALANIVPMRIVPDPIDNKIPFRAPTAAKLLYPKNLSTPDAFDNIETTFLINNSKVIETVQKVTENLVDKVN